MSYKSPQFIADFFNVLPMRTLINEVAPSLSGNTKDRVRVFISILIHEIFKNCEHLDDMLEVANDIQSKREDKEDNVFSNVDFSELIKESDGKLDKKSCEKITAEILDYMHPYFSGVVCDDSILTDLMNVEWLRDYPDRPVE